MNCGSMQPLYIPIEREQKKTTRTVTIKLCWATMKIPRTKNKSKKTLTSNVKKGSARAKARAKVARAKAKTKARRTTGTFIRMKKTKATKVKKVPLLTRNKSTDTVPTKFLVLSEVNRVVAVLCLRKILNARIVGPRNIQVGPATINRAVGVAKMGTPSELHLLRSTSSFTLAPSSTTASNFCDFRFHSSRYTPALLLTGT